MHSLGQSLLYLLSSRASITCTVVKPSGDPGCYQWDWESSYATHCASPLDFCFLSHAAPRTSLHFPGICFPESGLRQFLGDRDKQAPLLSPPVRICRWWGFFLAFFSEKRGFAEECLLNNCQAIAASISSNSW